MLALNKWFDDIWLFLSTNRDGIFTNLLSSGICFAIGLLIGFYFQLKQFLLRWRMRSFWQCKERVHVFHGIQRLGADDQTILRSHDLYAALEASDFIRTCFGRIAIIFQDASTVRDFDFVYRSDLILIGGPNNNLVTDHCVKELKKKGNLKIEFNGYALRRLDTKVEYPIELATDGSIICDYGFIYSMPSPFNSNYHLMIIAGCKGFGTHAAAKMLSRPELLKKIKSSKACTPICIIVKCTVKDGKVLFSDIVDVL